MRSVITAGCIVISALVLSACQQQPHREDAGAEMTNVEPACDCPPLPTIEELCPIELEALQPPDAEAEEQESEPSGPPPCVAPVVQPAGKQGQGHLIIGRVENVLLNINGGSKKSLKLKARIDTGAGLSSVHADQLVEFERDGEPWVRFSLVDPKSKKAVEFERPVKRYTSIKQLGGVNQKRPVIRLSLSLGNIEENLEVTLIDRTGYVYPVLIGRNLLRDRMVVDVSRKFIATQELRLDR